MSCKFQLKQKYGDWALITGGSSGIGLGFAKFLASIGINCILISNDLAALQQAKQEIVSQYPVQIEIYHIEFSNKNNILDFLAQNDFTKVGILINCAGIGRIGHFLQYKIEDYLALENINDTAMLVFTHHFANLFYKHNKKAAIINISSANAELNIPIPYSSVYSASKIWIKYFTESLFYELKDDNIDVLSVSAGPTKTNFQVEAGTKVLAWAEEVENVVNKSFKTLGKKSGVFTNNTNKLIITTIKWLPLTRAFKAKLLGNFFKNSFAKKSTLQKPTRN